jgi:hypothetical protein
MVAYTVQYVIHTGETDEDCPVESMQVDCSYQIEKKGRMRSRSFRSQIRGPRGGREFLRCDSCDRLHSSGEDTLPCPSGKRLYSIYYIEEVTQHLNSIHGTRIVDRDERASDFRYTKSAERRKKYHRPPVLLVKNVVETKESPE